MELTAGSVEYGGTAQAGARPRDDPRGRQQMTSTVSSAGHRRTAPPAAAAHRARLRQRHAGRVDEDPLGPVHVWTLIIFAVVSLGLTALLTWLTLSNLSNGRHGSRRIGGSSPTRSTSSSAPGSGWASSPSACSARW